MLWLSLALESRLKPRRFTVFWPVWPLLGLSYPPFLLWLQTPQRLMMAKVLCREWTVVAEPLSLFGIIFRNWKLDKDLASFCWCFRLIWNQKPWNHFRQVWEEIKKWITKSNMNWQTSLYLNKKKLYFWITIILIYNLN